MLFYLIKLKHGNITLIDLGKVSISKGHTRPVYTRKPVKMTVFIVLVLSMLTTVQPCSIALMLYHLTTVYTVEQSQRSSNHVTCPDNTVTYKRNTERLGHTVKRHTPNEWNQLFKFNFIICFKIIMWVLILILTLLSYSDRM